jgi:Polymerase beta, Nucleotidyltransferase
MEQVNVNALHAALEFAQIGKEIPTLQAVILFGSAAAGEMYKKSDIDLLLIFDTARNAETDNESKIIYRRAGEIERQYKLENPFSFVFLNRGEGIDADFLWEVTKNGFVLYLKPESVIGRQEFLTPSLLFSYSFQGIPPKDQMYINRRLYGYRSKSVHKGKEYVNEKPGLVQLYGKKLGRATFIIDARKSDGVRRLFDERGILHTVVKTWSSEQEARMVDIKDIKKKRFDFLRTLYDETDGDTWNANYTVLDLGEKLGFDPDAAEKIAQYLHDEGLIEIMDFDRHIRILHTGIQEVEEAIEHPNKPTDHFLPVNILQVGQMIDSQIAQASPGATQLNILTADDRPAIEEDLALLKKYVDQRELPPEQESDLRAEMDTIKAQMKSSKPKLTVIKESFGSIKEILQAAGAVATTAPAALQLLSMLHH